MCLIKLNHTHSSKHRYFFLKNEMFIIQTDYVEINKLTNCKIMSLNCFLHIYKVSWSIRKWISLLNQKSGRKLNLHWLYYEWKIWYTFLIFNFCSSFISSKSLKTSWYFSLEKYKIKILHTLISSYLVLAFHIIIQTVTSGSGIMNLF